MADSNTPTSSDATKLISLTNLETYTGYIERKSVPVTREQYTALPSTKLTDGISYFITDEGIIIKNGVNYGAPTSSDTTYSLSAGTGDDANKIILTPSSGTPDKVTVPYATSAGSADNATTVNNHTVASDVPADAVFTDNNTTYGLSVGTGDDANKIVLTPSTGTANKITVPYASNAGTVNGHSVAVDVPSDAEFTDTTYEEATTSTAGLLSSADKTKLNNLGTAAYRDIPTSGNASTTEIVMGSDTRLSDSRPASDVSAWAKAETKPSYTAAEVGAIATTAKGANGGVAELDSAGKVPSSQLPSYVDDVIEYDSLSDFPLTGESGKIYIAKDTNISYRWTGTTYAKVGSSLALGETSSTAYRGDRGKTAYDHSQVTSGNPHNVTKAEVGLGNVTNDKQIVGLASGTTEDHVITFGTDGYSVKDSGYTIAKSVPSDAKFTDTTYSDATTTTSGLMSSGDKTKINGIATGAEVNQNAFSNVTVGSTTIAADSKTDTLTIVAGDNVTLTPDATNDKLTIAATDTNTHRPIQVNGTEVLGNNTTALNLKAGTNVSLSNSSGTVTITATDTKYTAATAAPGNIASSGAVGTSTNYARQDHTHGITVATGDSAGQVKIAGQNASVKGFSDKQDKYTSITYAQWQALTPAQQAAKDYYISDYPSSAITAGNVGYNNSGSGMVANNVQSAVDELKSGLTSTNDLVGTLINTKYVGQSINLDSPSKTTLGLFDGNNITGTKPFTIAGGIGHVVMVFQYGADSIIEIIISPYHNKMAMRVKEYNVGVWSWQAWKVTTFTPVS